MKGSAPSSFIGRFPEPQSSSRRSSRLPSSPQWGSSRSLSPRYRSLCWCRRSGSRRRRPPHLHSLDDLIPKTSSHVVVVCSWPATTNPTHAKKYYMSTRFLLGEEAAIKRWLTKLTKRGWPFLSDLPLHYDATLMDGKQKIVSNTLMTGWATLQNSRLQCPGSPRWR